MLKKTDLAENLVTREQVSKFQESEFASNARSYLLDPPLNINRTIYCDTRDFIFSEIHFGNACRSGVTANMTIEEYEKAKSFPDGRYVIKVKKHKTRRTYGPANMTLTKEQYMWLKTFVNQFRAKVPIFFGMVW